MHQKGVREQENSLISRFLLKSGVKQMALEELRAAINKAWMVPGVWKFILMGREYYNIHIDNSLERDRILAKWNWPFEFWNI